jgi:hypothetical protein
VLPRSVEVTGLLKAWSGCDQAVDQLAVHVYDELRHMARRYMRKERAGNLCKLQRWSVRSTFAWRM